jgi:hypothetical protein
MARSRTTSSNNGSVTCPECGRTFSRPAALGAHRRRAHGVVGASARSRRSSPKTQRATATKASGTGASGSQGSRQRRRSAAASSDGRGGGRRGGVDRDQLLKALFPRGIPASESVIRAVNAWLDDAERLARMT